MLKRLHNSLVCQTSFTAHAAGYHRAMRLTGIKTLVFSEENSSTSLLQPMYELASSLHNSH